MAKPTAVTEAGTAKVLLLADSTVSTPGANTPAAVVAGTSGEATYPVGWLGVATHRQGDARGSAGGFTVTSPVVLAAGYDASAAGTVRGFRTDENGILVVKPTYAEVGMPLQQGASGVLGGVTVSAASELAITTAVAAQIGYLLRLEAVCIGTVLGGGITAGSWSLKNGTAGTVIQLLVQPKGTPLLGDRYVWDFPYPHRNSNAAQAFTITPSSTFLGTWMFIANGYRSVL